MSDLAPAFQGEVQFRRWSDSSTQGVQVTFALPDSEALEPLKHKAGKRFMAVLVEIGDDEQPVQQPAPAKSRDTRGPLCREACDYCVMPQFWEWVSEVYGQCDTREVAEQWVRKFCEVDSRMKLDTSPEAASLFVNYIRIPFARWQRERLMKAHPPGA